MNFRNQISIFSLLLLCSCQQYGSPAATTPARSDVSGNLTTGDNVMTLSINGSQCRADSYLNKPCVTVTICHTGTTTGCVTVDDILLDSGSYGLRVFKSALNGLGLSQETKSSASIAECVEFADSSTSWGPVKVASVKMGNEPAVTVPIQVIDSTFAAGHYDCGTPMTSPASANINGILGVGTLAADCGNDCVMGTANKMYYACTDTTCTGTTLSLGFQVQNPVPLLPTDNNGILIRIPSIATAGADSATGYLIFGVGTQENNTPPSTVTTLVADDSGTIRTTLAGTKYTSFLDTGSNGFFFPAPSGSGLTDCGNSDPTFDGWYCPTSTKTISITNKGISGTASSAVTFNVGHFINLYNSNKGVFAQIGGDSGGSTIDLGLPFYFGRDIYQGIENTSSVLGTGPYWAY